MKTIHTDLFVWQGDLVGRCPKCAQPLTGGFNSDHMDDGENNPMTAVTCVACAAMYLVKLGSLQLPVILTPVAKKRKVSK